MTRLVADGLYEAASFIRSWWDGGFNANQTGRDGSTNGAGSTSIGTGGAGIAGTKVLTLPSAAATLIAAFGMLFNNANVIGSTNSASPIQIIRAGTVELHINVNASGFLEVRRTTSTGTLLGTSSGHTALTTGTWYHLQVKVLLHTSAGSVQIKLDNQVVLTLSGIQTSGTSGSVTAVGYGNTATSGSNQNRVFVDDVLMYDTVDATATQGRANNDYPGPLKIAALLPAANGDSTQWTTSTGTNHAALVDETPPNTTDYVTSSTSGNLDLWTLADLPSTANVVHCVQVVTYAAADDAGAIGVKPSLKENSTVTNEATETFTGTTYAMRYSTVHDVRPSDSAAWTVADVNGLQAGVKVA